MSPGSSHCTCRGLNRVFQKSDGSCICQAGHVSDDDGTGLQGDESNGEEDCHPQVPHALQLRGGPSTGSAGTVLGLPG